MSISQEPAAGGTGGPEPEEIARLAVAAAIQAPSVHNTQPWWFSSDERELKVHADAERQLQVADPDGREMLISCGAALFNLRVALRHLGYVPEASILPNPALPSLVAQVRWRERGASTGYADRMFAEIERRRTHRDAFLPTPLPSGLLVVLHEEAAREGVRLRMADTTDQHAALAAAVTAAEHATRLDTTRVTELTQWVRPPGSVRLDGVPPTAYPATPEHSEPDFPGRDFAHGQGWGVTPSIMGPLHQSAGVVTLLTTDADQPADWIRAGQGLQRVLLAASAHGIVAALHSQPLELPELREFIRVRISEGAYPQMLLRFGSTDMVAENIRRPVEDVLL